MNIVKVGVFGSAGGSELNASTIKGHARRIGGEIALRKGIF